MGVYGDLWPKQRERILEFAVDGGEVRSICSLCGYEVSGHITKTSKAMRKHREKRHPHLNETRKKRRVVRDKDVIEPT